MNVLKIVDEYLDKITMYRLLLYYLIALLAVAVIGGQFGYLFLKPAQLIFSSLLLVLVCWVSNGIFAKLFKAPTNTESSLITGLILALIITPVSSVSGVLFLIVVSVLAMLSKYVLTINKQHIFNPAAVAVVVTGIVSNQTASWWVGNEKMLPFVLIGGWLLARKMRRCEQLLVFIGTALAATVLYTALQGGDIYSFVRTIILDTGLLFMAFVMLPEPMTSPTTRRNQRWYAILAGALFPPQAHLGTLYSTPQLDLVISNVFAYLIGPRVKVFPKLIAKDKLSDNIMSFTFRPKHKFAYQPGQYMEWTLPHPNTDSRGNRRYFTLASSPTEPDLMLGVKFYEKGSSFKRALHAMRHDAAISAAQLSGDFVMPKDTKQKLVFIAGGIGITPYRSMIKYLLDMDEHRTITLLYAASTTEEFVYQDIFDEAHDTLGIKVVNILGAHGVPEDWQGRTGRISAELIKEEVPDYRERTFYISGPQLMVESLHHLLKSELGIPGRQIITDFFPGYT